MAAVIDGVEDYFCIDSKPIEVCRFSRSKRCTMGKNKFEKTPSLGYCASQGMCYYGYKFHSVCGLGGIIHSFDLTKASVHDIHYLKNLKVDYSNCTVIGDRGYISASVQLDLFVKPQISDRKFHAELTRKSGNLYLPDLPKQEKNRDTFLTAM